MQLLKKAIPLCLLALALVLGITVLTPKSQAAVYEDLTYTVSNNQATITGYIGGSGALVIPEIIDGYPVTAIRYEAFQYTTITEVVIPDSVTSIGNSAFYMCYNLKSATIGNGVTSIGKTAFTNCSSLSSVTIGDSVATIGDDAFYSCSRLTNITIPASVTNIGNGAFSGCDSLTGIWVDSGNTKYASDHAGVLYNKDKSVLIQAPNALAGYYTIPYGVYNIGDAAFQYCDRLTGVTIPDSVTVIGASAFWACSSLTDVTLGAGVAIIEEDAFLQCTSLTNITLPNSVTTIGNHAFSECDSLTNITIPNRVTTISAATFSGCDSLAGVTIPDSVTAIGYEAFSNCISLTGITIPDSVTIIGYEAFSNCTSLAGVTIGAGVTTIDRQVFDNCSGLKNVYYSGSQSQWNSINIGVRNDALTDAAIHCDHVHDYTAIPPVTVQPTCTQPGYMEYTCAYGEAEKYVEYIPALGHSKGADTAVIAPACTQPGYTRSTCTRCGDLIKTDYVDALGHNVITGSVEAATCTEEGIKKGGTQCDRCQTVLTQPTVVPALGHDYVDGICSRCRAEEPVEETEHVHSWVTYPETEPTCNKAGNIAYQQCSACGAAQTDAGEPLEENGWVLEAYGHDWIEYPAVAPSCSAAGSIAYRRCFNCSVAQTAAGEPLEENGWILDATGAHTLVHYDAIGATCTTDGHEAVNYCTACDCFFYEDPLKLSYQDGFIPALGHTWVDYAAVAPTCYTDGNIAYQQCSVCGAAQTAGENPEPLDWSGWVVVSTGHSYVDHPAQAPTCEIIGWSAYQTCENCDYNTYVPQPSLGHYYVNYPAQAPTCTDAGWNAYQGCENCDYSTRVELPATGHSYADGVCTVCQAEETVAVIGDYTGEGDVNNEDVVYLLWHTLFPEDYAVNTEADITGDGQVNNEDVVRLLWHTLFPEDYPLTLPAQKEEL